MTADDSIERIRDGSDALSTAIFDADGEGRSGSSSAVSCCKGVPDLSDVTATSLKSAVGNTMIRAMPHFHSIEVKLLLDVDRDYS